MYSPDVSTTATLAATGAATLWGFVAAGTLVMAGVALVTIALMIRHRVTKPAD